MFSTARYGKMNPSTYIVAKTRELFKSQLFFYNREPILYENIRPADFTDHLQFRLRDPTA
jgi:hypothetical protein